MFHFGMLWVVLGHFLGLVIPKSWTSFIPEQTYHTIAVVGGAIAGILALVGVTILIYRRRTTGPVFRRRPRWTRSCTSSSARYRPGCINTSARPGRSRSAATRRLPRASRCGSGASSVPAAADCAAGAVVVPGALARRVHSSRCGRSPGWYVFGAARYFTRPYTSSPRDSRRAPVSAPAPGRGWDRSELQKK